MFLCVQQLYQYSDTEPRKAQPEYNKTQSGSKLNALQKYYSATEKRYREAAANLAVELQAEHAFSCLL